MYEDLEEAETPRTVGRANGERRTGRRTGQGRSEVDPITDPKSITINDDGEPSIEPQRGKGQR